MSNVATFTKLSQYSKKCLDAALKWAPKYSSYPKGRHKFNCVYMSAPLDCELLDGRDVLLIHFYIVTLTEGLEEKKRCSINIYPQNEWSNSSDPILVSGQLWNQSEVRGSSLLL